MVFLKWALIVGGIIVVLIACAGFALCAWLDGDVEQDEYYREWDDPDDFDGPTGGLNMGGVA